MYDGTKVDVALQLKLEEEVNTFKEALANILAIQTNLSPDEYRTRVTQVAQESVQNTEDLYSKGIEILGATDVEHMPTSLCTLIRSFLLHYRLLLGLVRTRTGRIVDNELIDRIDNSIPNFTCADIASERYKTADTRRLQMEQEYAEL